jgi:hypothetical protein
LEQTIIPSSSIPKTYIAFYEQHWGVPLDERFTRLPAAGSAIDQDDANEPGEEVIKDVLLPGNPFLKFSLFRKKLLVRAEYIRIFDAVESQYQRNCKTVAVVTGQPGIGKKCH